MLYKPFLLSMYVYLFVCLNSVRKYSQNFRHFHLGISYIILNITKEYLLIPNTHTHLNSKFYFIKYNRFQTLVLKIYEIQLQFLQFMYKY